MELVEVENHLKDDDYISRNSFELAKNLCTLYNNADSQSVSKVQNLVIRSLEKYELFGSSKIIIDNLLRELKLFPYLNSDELSLADALAYFAHTTDIGNDSEAVLHGPQAEIFYKLLSGVSVVLSAPTSFGKSLIIDAVIASQKFSNIVVVVPTISLIDETRRRLSKFKENYKVITHSLQGASDKNIYVLTQERVIEEDFVGDVDFFVIDEFYKLSTWADSGNRCALLNEAFYRLYKKCEHFYMLGPNINGVAGEFVENVKFEFVKYNYNTVVTEIHDFTGSDKEGSLIDICEKVEGPTIVFSSSPDRANKAAELIYENIRTEPGNKARELAAWVSENYHEEWILTKALKNGVGIHHARIPRGISQYIVDLFNSGEIKYLVCTSTLIEGVNTSAKNIVCYDDSINRKKLDIFTFNNISGRSGRMFKHFVGNVYILSPPPIDQLPLVELPLYNQDENTPDSLLLNIDENDLTEKGKEKIKKYYEQDHLSLETIRLNKTIDPSDQVNFAKALETNFQNWSHMLLWRGYPDYEQLSFICTLIWNNFNGKSLGNRSISSAKQLAFKINQLMSKPTIHNIVNDRLNYNADSDITSIITKELDFKRLWANFHFPRIIRAIETITNEYLRKHKIDYECEYTAYASSVENYFYDSSIVALEEYGLPIEISALIEDYLSTDGDLDEALNRLSAVDTSKIEDPVIKSFLERAAYGI